MPHLSTPNPSLYPPLTKEPPKITNMPELSEITYSRDDTVAAVRDYYQFLTKLYLDPSYIITPPPSGWPSITTQHSILDKCDEVIDLLRHLPYIKTTLNDTIDAEATPECTFADYHSIFTRCSDRKTITIGTEDPAISEFVPKHVIGLTCGGSSNPRFLLDVKLGTVLWYRCPEIVREGLMRETVEDDPYEYCEGSEEAEWRGEGETWAIADFFEELKGQYRRLAFVPLSSRKVVRGYKNGPPGYEDMLEGVRGVYRRFGWPDEERYDKRECLRAVAEFLEERYPEFKP